jgi:hypothetical protein
VVLGDDSLEAELADGGEKRPPVVEPLACRPRWAVETEALEHLSALEVRLARELDAVSLQEVEDDERHRHGHVPVEHASANVREVGLASLPRDELAVEDESGRKCAKLRQDLSHFPTAAAPHSQVVLGRDERAEAVPLQLEGPPRAGGQRPGASEHRVRQPQKRHASGLNRFR